MVKNMNPYTTTLRTPWLAVAAASAALMLAAGCIDDTRAAAVEPAADDTKAIMVPAGPDTTASLGIATWRYVPTDEGIVVRGVASDATAHSRFWITDGETADERIAHATDTGAEVSIPREGAVTGTDAGLRTAVTAFRSDVELAQAHRKGDAQQNVNDNVVFCPGSVGTFSTWAFWATTTIAIDNPFQDKWLKFSFQAGAGYEEQWIPPAPASTYPWLAYWRQYPRQYWAVPVTIRYLDSWPDGIWGPCRSVQVY
jgi:hypothetical protein